MRRYTQYSSFKDLIQVCNLPRKPGGKGLRQVSTTIRYYVENKSTQLAQKGFETLSKLRLPQLSGSCAAEPNKVMFTADEGETISSYFQSYIEAGDRPTASDFKTFLRDHPI